MNDARSPQSNADCVVAIDGPAGAGKSTCARLLAVRLGYRFLDSGALYRALTLKAMREGLAPSDEDALAELAGRTNIVLQAGSETRVVLDGEDVSQAIRGPGVTNAVPTVASLPRVRAAMFRIQREFAADCRTSGVGVVAEGRDIGTVVFPGARWKFFLDADPAVRAGRRAKERGDRDVAAVERSIRERDKMDTERHAAPLRAAEDAIVVDTSALDLNGVLEVMERRIRGVPGR